MNLKIVERYHELGIIVHPCCPPNHWCLSPGKVPFDPYTGQHMTGWQNHEQFPLERWEEWLDLEPEINIGMLCGSASKMVLIDIDTEEGLELFYDQAGREDHGGWEYRTGRECGLRVCFAAVGSSPSRKVSRGDSHFEILGDGRNSVVPPSIHPSGRRYQWDNLRSPKHRRCAEQPDWIRGLHTSLTDDLSSIGEDWGKLINAGAREGERNIVMTKIVGRLMSPTPMSAREAMAVALAINQSNFSPPMSEEELRKIVKSISKRQAISKEAIEREVWAIAKKFGCSYEEATTIWEDHDG